MQDELSEYAHASVQGRRRIRAANAAKGAQARGFQAIGYRNPLSNMPRGGQQSPRGDLGALRMKEARKVFPGKKPKRGPDSAEVRTAR